MFNSTYSVKLIEAGQARVIKSVRAGLGISGNAIVIPATKGARFQLVDVVTQTSPERLSMKRVGDNLHIALPGGEIGSPDVILQDFYAAEGTQLQGASLRGEWQSYATQELDAGIVSSGAESGPSKTIGYTNAGLTGWFHDVNPWLLAAGGVGVLAALSGGGSGKSDSAATDPLSVMKNFTSDTAAIGSKTAASPTLQTYKDLGIKAYASLADTSDADRIALTGSNLSALNSALDKLDAASLTKEKVQAMVDAYYRILSEADGKPDVNTDVYADTTNDAANAASYNDPTAADYAAVGAKIGATTHALQLLNDAVGRHASTAVDTIEEIEALAQAAENVMLWASQDTGASADPTATSTGPSVYTTDAQWINGLSKLGITGLSIELMADIKAALKAAANDGSTVDTVKELQELLNPVISLKVLKDFTADTATIGSKTVVTPTLVDWDSLTQANTSLSDDTRIKTGEATYWKTTNAANGLAALNSALDTVAQADVTAAKLQAIVDSYGRILQEADGNRFVNTDVSAVSQVAERDGADLIAQDLLNIGVRIANTASISDASSQKSLMLSAIGALSSTSVDTVDELNAISVVADNIMRESLGQSVTYTDTDWINALSKLGITGATSSNIAHVKAAIDDAVPSGASTCEAIDTYAELQAIVSLTRVKDYADVNTNATPTIDDYQFLSRVNGTEPDNYTVAKSNNLAAYNDVVNRWDSTSTITETQVKDLVISYNTILDLADGNRATTTPEIDSNIYSALGVDAGTSDARHLLTNVIDGFTKDRIDTVNELLALAQTSKSIMDLSGTVTPGGVTSSTALQGSSSITLTRAELTALGLTDGAGHLINEASGTTYWVSDAELMYFRNSIASQSHTAVDTLVELQALMQQAIIAA